jgi:integrase
MPIKRQHKTSKPTGVPGIREIGENRFLVTVTWLDEKTNQQKRRKGVAGSLEEAVVLRDKIRRGEEPERLTRTQFADFAQRWLKARLADLAESSQYRYINTVAQLMTYFGRYWVDAISPMDVREWLAIKSAETYVRKKAKMHGDVVISPEVRATYSKATLNGWLNILREMLSSAEEEGLVPFNAAKKTKALNVGRTQGRRGRALSPKDFATFFQTLRGLVEKEEITPDVERMLIVAAWSGMRRGEIMALRFEDLIDGELHVVRSVWKRKEKSTKTDDPRIVAATGPIEAAIQEQRRALLARQHPGLASGLVFPAEPEYAEQSRVKRNVLEVSWYRSMDVLRKPIAKVVEAAGLQAITLHSFRRTYENLLRQAGVDDLTRRSLAGWRTETAQEIYARVDKSERVAAVQAMATLVGQNAWDTRLGHPAPEDEKGRKEGSSNQP